MSLADIPVSKRHRFPSLDRCWMNVEKKDRFGTGFQHRFDIGSQHRSDTEFQYRPDTGFQYRSIIKGRHLFGIGILNTINIKNNFVYIIFI